MNQQHVLFLSECEHALPKPAYFILRIILSAYYWDIISETDADICTVYMLERHPHLLNRYNELMEESECRTYGDQFLKL